MRLLLSQEMRDFRRIGRAFQPPSTLSLFSKHLWTRPPPFLTLEVTIICPESTILRLTQGTVAVLLLESLHEFLEDSSKGKLVIGEEMGWGTVGVSLQKV